MMGQEKDRKKTSIARRLEDRLRQLADLRSSQLLAPNPVLLAYLNPFPNHRPPCPL